MDIVYVEGSNRALIREYRKTNDTRILNKILKRNLPFAKMLVAQYARGLPNSEWDDVVQESLVGMYEDIGEFDTERGTRFTGYCASHMTRARITRYISRNYGRGISSVIYNGYKQTMEAINQYRMTPHESRPHLEVLSKRTGMPVNDLNILFNWLSMSEISLDDFVDRYRPDNRKITGLPSRYMDPFEELSLAEKRKCARFIFERLNREQQVTIKGRAAGKKLREVANDELRRMKGKVVTRECVRQIEERGSKKFHELASLDSQVYELLSEGTAAETA